MIKKIKKYKMKEQKHNTFRYEKKSPQKKNKTHRISKKPYFRRSVGAVKNKHEKRVNNHKIKKLKMKKVNHKVKTRKTRHQKINSTQRITNRLRGGGGSGIADMGYVVQTPPPVSASASAPVSASASAPGLYVDKIYYEQLFKGEDDYNNFWYDTIHDRINPWYDHTQDDNMFLNTPRKYPGSETDNDKKTLKEKVKSRYQIVNEREQLLPLSESVGKVRDAGYPGPSFPTLFSVLDGAPSSAANHYMRLSNPPGFIDVPGIGQLLDFNKNKGMCYKNSNELYYFKSFMYQLDVLLYDYYKDIESEENKDKENLQNISDYIEPEENKFNGSYYKKCHLYLFNQFWKRLLKSILDEQKIVFMKLYQEKTKIKINTEDINEYLNYSVSDEFSI